MKAIYKILYALLPLLALSACSKEDPFGPEGGPTGILSTKSLTLELNNEENLILTKSPLKLPKYIKGVEKKDFSIRITLDGATRPAYTFKYNEMPEIVTLPVGKYKVEAVFGTNQSAAFEAPYFYGMKEFEIFENKITDDIGPIVAGFANVRVTVIFDPVLLSHCSPDSKVTVRVGKEGTLQFTPQDMERSGYFRFISTSRTLAAEFDGLIDGVQDNASITFNNVAAGNHYRLTFRLVTPASGDVGDSSVTLKVDGSCESTDMNISTDTEWEPIEDDRNPDTPPAPPATDGPTIVAAPGTGLNLDAVNDVDADSKVALNVSSATGFTKFDVIIDDDELADLLEISMGVRYFDLINPGVSLDACHSLGLLDDEQTSLSGEKFKAFDVSGFMPMLVGVGSGKTFVFRLVVGDSKGTLEKELKLRTR